VLDPEDIEHQRRGHAVESARFLVGEEEIGLVGHRPCDGDALLSRSEGRPTALA
jgi:hypothetical protein